MTQAYIKPLQILKASAGSGKTFSLTLRFLSLLFSGDNKYRRIMAVTFTNKATAEMKHRILSVLEMLAKGDWDNAKGYLSELRNQFPELSLEQIQQKSSLIYRQILHDYGRLTITTIDKFVQQIIRSFTFELGIDADYQVTLNTKKVAADLSEMLHQSLNEKPDLLEWIIERAKSRINDGKAWNYQNELQNLSFEIFKEKFQAFDETVNEENSDDLFKTTQEQINSIKVNFEAELKTLYESANRIFLDYQPNTDILRGKSKSPLLHFNKPYPAFLAYVLKNGVTQFEKIIDDEAAWFGKEADENDRKIFSRLNPCLAEICQHFNLNISSYHLTEAIDENLFYLRLMKEMSSLLKQYRSDNSLLLISDATLLLEGLSRGMEDNPSFIWEKAGNRYQHFLFDEFQDTSENQWINFKPLVKNALGLASGKRIEHLIVGDVKQSIYRWRGGDWKILLRDVESSLGKAFVDTASLQTNYRSDALIIKFNNYIFPSIAKWIQQHLNDNILEKNGNEFYESFWHHNGYDQIIEEAYRDVQQEVPALKNLQSGIVDWKIFDVESNRYRGNKLRESVLQEIADRLFRWIAVEKRYRAGQVGILVRTNNEAQDLLSYLKIDLQKRGHPNAYSVISGDAVKLNDNQVIQLILQTFRLFCQPKSEQGLFQTRCVYLYRTIQSQSPPLSTGDWMNVSKPTLQDELNYLPKRILKEQKYLLQLPLAALFEELLSIYQLTNQENVLAYLFAFRDCIAEFTDSGNSGLAEFLEWWDTQEDRSLPVSEENTTVQIMTVHKSKGLAFDVVVLPFLFFPFDGKKGSQVWVNTENTDFDQLQTLPLKYGKHFANSQLKGQYYEEQLYCYMDALNTLYVAMTRPRKHLFLCLPGFNNKLPDSILAGDALVAALEQYELKNGTRLIFPEPATELIESDQQTKQQNLGWAFTNYPLSNRLKKQMSAASPQQLKRLDNDENIRIGMAVHELLSLCHEPKDIPATIHKLAQEGWFSNQESQTIQELAIQVLENPQLQSLLQRPGIFLNERDLIDSHGNTHRPDKVLIGEKETIIIDFKFTGKENKKHYEQVQLYRKLFREMGYQNVKGYLFYGFQQKLETVNQD